MEVTSGKPRQFSYRLNSERHAYEPPPRLLLAVFKLPEEQCDQRRERDQLELGVLKADQKHCSYDCAWTTRPRSVPLETPRFRNSTVDNAFCDKFL